MITFNPNKRITIEEAMRHPYSYSINKNKFSYVESIKDDNVEDPIYEEELIDFGFD